MELLDAENEHVLNAINHNNPGDPMQCTSAMFRLWLERQPGASWNQLIEALKAPSIRLEALAFKIEGMLLEGIIIWIIYVCNTSIHIFSTLQYSRSHAKC